MRLGSCGLKAGRVGILICFQLAATPARGAALPDSVDPGAVGVAGFATPWFAGFCSVSDFFVAGAWAKAVNDIAKSANSREARFIAHLLCRCPAISEARLPVDPRQVSAARRSQESQPCGSCR